MLATALNWNKSNTNSQISLEILPKTIEIVQSKAGKLDKEETGGLPYFLEEDPPFLIDRLLKKVKWKKLNLTKAFETIKRDFEVDLDALFKNNPLSINDKETSQKWSKTLLRYHVNIFIEGFFLHHRTFIAEIF